MIDTIYYKVELLNARQDSLDALCPIVIERTAKTCCGDAVSLAWVICGAIVIVTIVVAAAVLLGQYLRNNHIEETGKEDHPDNNGSQTEERKNELEDRNYKDKKEYIAKLIDFREKTARQDSDYKNKTDESCQDYINLCYLLIFNISYYRFNLKNSVFNWGFAFLE